VNLERRFQNQINSLQLVFEQVLQVFYQQRPVDNWLTNYFRLHHQIGSKDRKRISNAIFGYFRWYGWLKKILPSDHTLALLLGYLLDDNGVDDMIQFWSGHCAAALNVTDKLDTIADSGLKQKQEIVSNLIGQVTLAELNPSFVRGWSDEKIGAFQKRPNIWIRISDSPDRFLQFLAEKQVVYRLLPSQKHSLEIMSPVNLFESEDYRQGKIEVQDIASQGIGLICNPSNQDVWWDVCAGSGGKALHLSSLMQGMGKIYATEVDQPRFAELKKRLARHKMPHSIEPTIWNGTALPRFEPIPTKVLVDAPCTCSGTWRRAPDIRWRLADSTISYYSELQLGILNLASSILNKDGTLVYATCSIFDEENEKVVERFLGIHPDFQLLQTICPFTGKTHGTGIHFEPPEINGNAMFAAVMIRT
jgi:16S rRNA (cytosine967-C5)-methyltransferase